MILREKKPVIRPRRRRGRNPRVQTTFNPIFMFIVEYPPAGIFRNQNSPAMIAIGNSRRLAIGGRTGWHDVPGAHAPSGRL
jgi:hypothetical protein